MQEVQPSIQSHYATPISSPMLRGGKGEEKKSKGTIEQVTLQQHI